MIQVFGPRDKPLYKVVNTTSGSSDFGRDLSPFLLGPVKVHLYHPEIQWAKNVENAWQFSKVYKKFVDKDNNPTEDYFKWAKQGMEDDWAHRYPMGKNAKPLYALYDDDHLDYIESRKHIYYPYYKKAVLKSETFKKLVEFYKENKNISLFDYDGYDDTGLSFEEVINNPKKKMGHAFVLKELLKEYE